MGRIVASTYITLDGVMDEPQNWSLQYFDESAGQLATEVLFAADALLLGRKTYENFAAAWPNRPAGDPFTDRMNGMPKYVASRTLEKAEWNNSHLLRGEAADTIAELKEQEQTLLVYGSATLTQTLLAHELLDELRLWLHPLVLGGGKRLFGDAALGRLRLEDERTLPSGVVVLTYAPVVAEMAASPLAQVSTT
jgi:dihydrofolate reductase